MEGEEETWGFGGEKFVNRLAEDDFDGTTVVGGDFGGDGPGFAAKSVHLVDRLGRLGRIDLFKGVIGIDAGTEGPESFVAVDKPGAQGAGEC